MKENHFESMPVIRPHAAGIDIGSRSHDVGLAEKVTSVSDTRQQSEDVCLYFDPQRTT